MESLASLGYSFDQYIYIYQLKLINRNPISIIKKKKTHEVASSNHYFAIEFVSSVPNILYLDLVFLRLNVWD